MSSPPILRANSILFIGAVISRAELHGTETIMPLDRVPSRREPARTKHPFALSLNVELTWNFVICFPNVPASPRPGRGAAPGYERSESRRRDAGGSWVYALVRFHFLRFLYVHVTNEITSQIAPQTNNFLDTFQSGIELTVLPPSPRIMVSPQLIER